MESQPDHTDNPSGADTGQGYPEQEQGEPRGGDDPSPGEDSEQPSSPKSSGGRDSAPGSATGNRGAAG